MLRMGRRVLKDIEYFDDVWSQVRSDPDGVIYINMCHMISLGQSQYFKKAILVIQIYMEPGVLSAVKKHWDMLDQNEEEQNS